MIRTDLFLSEAEGEDLNESWSEVSDITEESDVK